MIFAKEYLRITSVPMKTFYVLPDNFVVI